MSDEPDFWVLTWSAFDDLVNKLHERILERVKNPVVFGIPSGGSPVATALVMKGMEGAYSFGRANVIVDDLVDTGRTAKAALSQHKVWATHSEKPYFDALLRKPYSPKKLAPQARVEKEWIVFPWENMDGPEIQSIEGNIERVLQYIGEDPTREGLRETPRRVVKAIEEMTEGYHQNPDAYCKVFHEEHSDEMVVLQGITFTSMCEHHLLPFWGTASIGYIPDGGRIIGLSKLARILHTYARRLQNQERLTHQVVDFLHSHEELSPLGAGAVIRSHHTCMSCRGLRQQGSEMVTSATLGAIRDDPAARAEFMRLCIR